MSIQIDGGEFTRLHNTILEKLALARLTGGEYRCLMFLFRMTYGWQRKEHEISMAEWAEGVGIEQEKRHNAWRTLQGMIEKGVIYAKSNGNNRPMTWGFNKDFDAWDASLFEQTVMPQDNTIEASVITQDNKTVMPQDNTPVISHDNTPIYKELKKELKKEKKAISSSSAEQNHQTTAQQEMFGAICEAIGWDFKTLSKDDRGQIAQTVGILQKAEYSTDDVRRFMIEFWFKDWRWTDKAQRPTLKQLRQEIGKIRATLPENTPKNRPKLSEQERGNLLARARSAQSSIRTAEKFGGNIDPSWQRDIEAARGAGLI